MTACLCASSLYLIAFTTSAATDSMSSAFSLVNGRGMSVRDRTTAPLAVTSKQPLRGFSAFITTLAPGTAALMNFSRFTERVLKAPQDLHASI
eukprot:CAMPEP_0206161546 /NCGR_PEP_ID=MMETSP1474-20131121/7749_1 /ASSEMBLY_ACC=CAM_ASM_001110 /TAXON_ID=97495 /ORGANISM="Imantonia sp., Strain RCC918" /LENGTH=92 /DNA_ID=CAMNT_0053563501 /DNA_START=257 /DNA_END=535 /DNA_ORIENTATION=-